MYILGGATTNIIGSLDCPRHRGVVAVAGGEQQVGDHRVARVA
jgi:hypothetical protein